MLRITELTLEFIINSAATFFFMLINFVWTWCCT